MNPVDLYCETHGVSMPPGNVQDAVQAWAVEEILRLRKEARKNREEDKSC